MSKYALITGGTKGIGYAVASCLAKRGYNLLLTYRSDTVIAQKSCDDLRTSYGIEATAIQADSADRQSIDRIALFIESRGIRLDVLLFNAGLTDRSAFETMQYEAWNEVFYANVHFPVFLLQRLLPQINVGGSVVFTGSLMGLTPHALSLAYGVTKATVHALVKNLVKFLTPYQIRVNAVAPGFVDTDWQKGKPATIRKNIEEKIALQRFCDPEELAGIYQLLFENTYINGEIIFADGGYACK